MVAGLSEYAETREGAKLASHFKKVCDGRPELKLGLYEETQSSTPTKE